MSLYDYLHPLWRTTLSKDADKNKTVLNKAVLETLDKELDKSEQEALISKVEIHLDTANNTWLDYWGSWFGFFRKSTWEDDEYRTRLKNYVTTSRNTIPSIKQAIANFLETDVEYVDIYEPWNNIFVLNESKLNGQDRLEGGYYNTAVIDIHIGVQFDTGVIDVINAFRPAGVVWFLTFDSGVGKPDDDTITLMSPYNLIVHEYEEEMINYVGFNNDHVFYLPMNASINKLNSLFANRHSLLDYTDNPSGSTYFNYVSTSRQPMTLNGVNTIGDANNRIPRLDSSAYEAMGDIDGSVYSYTPQSGVDYNYINIGLDVAYYLYTMYQSQQDVQGSLSSNRTLASYISSYFDSATLQIFLNNEQPEEQPLRYNLKVYSYLSGNWETFANFPVTSNHAENDINLTHNLANYLSPSGILFVSLEIPTTVISKVDIERISLITSHNEDKSGVVIFSDNKTFEEEKEYNNEIVQAKPIETEVERFPYGQPIRYIRASMIASGNNPGIAVLGANTLDNTTVNYLANMTNSNDGNHLPSYGWFNTDKATLDATSDGHIQLTLPPNESAYYSLGPLLFNTAYTVYVTPFSTSNITLDFSVSYGVGNSRVSKNGFFTATTDGVHTNLLTFTTSEVTPDGNTLLSITNPSNTSVTVTLTEVGITPNLSLIVDGKPATNVLPHRVNGTAYSAIQFPSDGNEHVVTVDLGQVHTNLHSLIAKFGATDTDQTTPYKCALQYSSDNVNWYSVYDNYKGTMNPASENYNEKAGVDISYELPYYDSYNSVNIDEPLVMAQRDNIGVLSGVLDKNTKPNVFLSANSSIPGGSHFYTLGAFNTTVTKSQLDLTPYTVRGNIDMVHPNLLQDSGFESGNDHRLGVIYTSDTRPDIASPDGICAVVMEDSKTMPEINYFWTLDNPVYIKANQPFTISYKYTAAGDAPRASDYWYDSADTPHEMMGHASQDRNSQNTWKTVSFTYQFPQAVQINKLRFGFQHDTPSDAWKAVDSIKIELGLTATPYSVSPLDYTLQKFSGDTTSKKLLLSFDLETGHSNKGSNFYIGIVGSSSLLTFQNALDSKYTYNQMLGIKSTYAKLLNISGDDTEDPSLYPTYSMWTPIVKNTYEYITGIGTTYDLITPTNIPKNVMVTPKYPVLSGIAHYTAVITLDSLDNVSKDNIILVTNDVGLKTKIYNMKVVSGTNE